MSAPVVTPPPGPAARPGKGEAPNPVKSALRGRARLAPVAGLAAAVAGLGVGELVAGVVAPSAGLVLSIGTVVIDLAPAWLKTTVIALFGTADKIVLIICVVLLVLALSALAGWLEWRRSPWGRILLGAGAAVGLIIVMMRNTEGALAALPAIATGIVGVILLGSLVDRLRPDDDFREVPKPQPIDRVDRRRFLAWAGGSAVVGVVAVVGGQVLASGRRAVEAARRTFTLPAPKIEAPPVPAGVQLDVPGISPFITPNADFYRIDTALSVPNVDPSSWRLKITGMVENEIEIGYEELLALPLEESITTLMCVSNYVGGDLIGTATWLGYPLRDLLARAVPSADADMVLSTSVDGFTASTPLGILTDDRNAILAVGMNGEPLPLEHGYPVRMVVPGLYGYVSATKWVTSLEVTRFDQATAYWTDRGWSAEGPIKISSRIDVPRGGSAKAGDVVVAGVAWFQHIGIKGVQVRVDDGEWNDASLADQLNDDTWRQWAWTWPATSGSHTIAVRAIGADGQVQTDALADVIPDGATGLHTITVQVD